MNLMEQAMSDALFRIIVDGVSIECATAESAAELADALRARREKTEAARQAARPVCEGPVWLTVYCPLAWEQTGAAVQAVLREVVQQPHGVGRDYLMSLYEREIGCPPWPAWPPLRAALSTIFPGAGVDDIVREEDQGRNGVIVRPGPRAADALRSLTAARRDAPIDTPGAQD